MNTALSWLYAQYNDPAPSGNARCYLCGLSCPEQFTVAKGIADTFNSHYLAACPSSPWLCAACQWYFDSKAGHPDFRKMSLIVREFSWFSWERATMKDYLNLALSRGIEQDEYLVVSLSKKKHILLQASMSTKGTRNLAIQVEEQVAHLDRVTWEYINVLFCDLLRLGHGKGEIISGSLYGPTLRKHGQIIEALTANEQLAPYRNSAILDLLSYVTIVNKESEESDAERDSSTRIGSEIATSSVQSDQSRLQKQVSSIDLGTSRVERLGSKSDYEQLDLFS